MVAEVNISAKEYRELIERSERLSQLENYVWSKLKNEYEDFTNEDKTWRTSMDFDISTEEVCRIIKSSVYANYKLLEKNHKKAEAEKIKAEAEECKDCDN